MKRTSHFYNQSFGFMAITSCLLNNIRKCSVFRGQCDNSIAEKGQSSGQVQSAGRKLLPSFNYLKYIPTKNCLPEIYIVKPKIS